MASRGGSKKPPVPDFHLWEDVAETVSAPEAAPTAAAARAVAAAANSFAAAETSAAVCYAGIPIAATRRGQRRLA